MAHFTTIASDFPESRFAHNAKFYAKQLAALMERQDNAFKARVLRVIGPLFPRNPAVFVPFLSYLIGVLGFLAYDWNKVKRALFVERQLVPWVVLLLSISLLTVNYVIEWRHSATLLDIPKILEPLKR